MGIGTVQLASVLHDRLGLHDRVSTWLGGVDLAQLGVGLVVAFALLWALALLRWRDSPATPASPRRTDQEL